MTARKPTNQISHSNPQKVVESVKEQMKQAAAKERNECQEMLLDIRNKLSSRMNSGLTIQPFDDNQIVKQIEALLQKQSVIDGGEKDVAF